MERPIRIATIAGSPRPANNTAKALALVENELETHPKVQVVSLKPFSLNLPFPGMSGDFPGQTQLHDAVRDATAVVFATPEYHGSFSALTKLAIENLGFPSVLSGKPIGLLGEPPRVSRRLQLLRGWSHDKTKQVFTGDERARSADGFRPAGSARISVVSDLIDCVED